MANSGELKKKKVIVGLSGGVDSAVTAYLLKEAGYEVIGVNLMTSRNDIANSNIVSGRTAGEQRNENAATRDTAALLEGNDCEAVAEALDIPLYREDCALKFRKEVIAPFIDDYLSARTPNPCVGCNRCVKWQSLLHAMEKYGGDYVATGHYAKVERLSNGRFSVCECAHREKDQSYMLYQLTQTQLSRTIFPLGDYTKTEIRKIAAKAGLPVANKKDSEDICFLPDGDYGLFIEKKAKDRLLGAGNFVSEDGEILGTHRGIIHYTVGQRKHLNLALGYPAYVKEIVPSRNEVVISTNEALFRDKILCNELCFMSIPDLPIGERISARARIRYRHRGEAALITRTREDEVTVEFEAPVRAPAPGQSAVFYDEEGRIIGGGKIAGERIPCPA